GAANDHALAFTLRKNRPRPLGEVFAFDLFEDAGCADAVRWLDAAPVIDHGVLAADDRSERRLGLGHHLSHGRADQAYPLAQLAPVGFAVAPTEHGDFATRRSQVAGQRAEQGRFSRTIRAQDDPVLPAFDSPRNSVEDHRPAAA